MPSIHFPGFRRKVAAEHDPPGPRRLSPISRPPVPRTGFDVLG
ncbi:hypothetical protein [Nonomuraea basaltis]|nr:hypothetical protein [Nonomuraea basaltis]